MIATKIIDDLIRLGQKKEALQKIRTNLTNLFQELNSQECKRDPFWKAFTLAQISTYKELQEKIVTN